MPEDQSIHILIDRVHRVACHQCGHRIDVSNLAPFTSVTCPACGIETPVPAQLGQFLLFKELGKGAMGAVYQAFDKTLKRHVAIKVMHRSLGQDRQFVEQFLGEARALAALNHPNVVQIYSCGQEKGQPYIVMELVPGGRVDKLMTERGPLEEDFVLHVGIDVAQGLQAAHRIGLTHGDIKPENILFARDGTAKVVDFGLARFAGGKPQPGEIWGTPFYIAPEKVQGQQGDHQSDIYSLGASLFHAMANQPPFDGKTAQDVVLARLKHPPSDLRESRQDAHEETAQLITRMLEPDRFKRYPNYDSLLADMRRTREAVATKPARTRGPTPSKRAPLVLGAVTALIVAAVTAGGIWWVRRDARPPPRRSASPRRMKLVDGKLVPITPAPRDTETHTRSPLRPSTPSAEAPAPRRPPKPAPKPAASIASALSSDEADFIIDTALGMGADAYVRGRSSRSNYADQAFGGRKYIWVKSVGNDDLHLARKIYLRFDLSSLRSERVRDAALALTTVRGGKNAADRCYSLSLWGIPPVSGNQTWTDRSGPDAITWNTAPANALRNSDRLDRQHAVLLAQISIPPNPSPGTTITFSNHDSMTENALRDFINASGDSVSFAVTADATHEQRAGWKFASREATSKSPPTLLLKR